MEIIEANSRNGCVWSEREPPTLGWAGGQRGQLQNLGLKWCYCTINIKHLNLQPKMIYYWLWVAVTGRGYREVSVLGWLTSNVDRRDEGSEHSQCLSSRSWDVAPSHQGQTTHSRQTCRPQTFQYSWTYAFIIHIIQGGGGFKNLVKMSQKQHRTSKHEFSCRKNKKLILTLIRFGLIRQFPRNTVCFPDRKKIRR